MWTENKNDMSIELFKVVSQILEFTFSLFLKIKIYPISILHRSYVKLICYVTYNKPDEMVNHCVTQAQLFLLPHVTPRVSRSVHAKFRADQ